MTDTTIFVGLDVHEETIAVAMAPASPGAAFSYYGAIAGGPCASYVGSCQLVARRCSSVTKLALAAMWFSGGSAVGAIGVMSWRPI